MDTHAMTLVGNTPDGDEIWTCPICGREFLITWQPKFNKMILVEGDQYVTHSGVKGGLKITGVKLGQSDIGE